MFIAAHNGAHVWGGAERGVSLILAGLQRKGHRVLLFCNDERVARNAAALGVPVEILPLGGDVAVWDAARFALVLRRRAPDVLLIGTFKKLWLGALAGRLAGVPVVARIGLETDTPRSRKYRFVMTHWVDAVVLKADDVRDRYLAALPRVPAGRILTVHGGVEPRPPSRPSGALRRELGLPDDAWVLGTVARLARQKRLDRLLGAMARLPERAHLLIAGDGEERASVEARIRQPGLAGRVHLLGHRDDVGDVLAALDVFVVSSDREMLSFAMLEAMAAGVPVVSTPVSGAAEALEPMPDGSAPGVVTGFDEEELAGALRRLLGDAPARAAMGRAAAERARERFGYQRMLDEWERVLRSVAA